MAPLLARATPVQYGARALNEGGWQSLPALSFPGGAILGCAAGTLDAARIKGAHMAVKSGALAAEAAAAALLAQRRQSGTEVGRSAGSAPLDLSSYDQAR